MKLKIITNILTGTLTICSILGLNAIATHIDYPELQNKTVFAESDVKSVAQLEIENLVDKTAKEYGLEPAVVKAIITVESGWNASAVGDGGESIGLMQVQPRWHSHRLSDGESLFTPEVNVRVGCEILSELIGKYGNYEDALSVYNSGNTEDGKAYAERILRK